MEILTYTKKDLVRRVVNNQHSRVGETARLVEGVFEVLPVSYTHLTLPTILRV